MGKIERIGLAPGDRERLEKLVRDRKTPQKLVWRVRIMLLAADGVGAVKVGCTIGKSVVTVRRWRRRYAAAPATRLGTLTSSGSTWTPWARFAVASCGRSSSAIGTQVHHGPVPWFGCCRGRPGAEVALPGAGRFYRQCLSLPLFPAMTTLAAAARAGAALRPW